MPVIVPDNLPAKKTLLEENIFVMDEMRAIHQDIRPLKIAVLNLMPNKIETETQIIRLLSNSPLQIDLTLLTTKTYQPKHTSKEHLFKFYEVFDDIKNQKFDGFVITGAPVEKMDFEEVDYWSELQEIMDYTKTNVTSTMHICWGAQAGLYHHFGIPKYPLPHKMFGIFKHHITCQKSELLRGFDDVFYIPHSRHTEVRKEDIEKVPALKILAESWEAGPSIIVTKDYRQIFLTGHSEYDPLTLQKEYERDLKLGLDIELPENYFYNDDPAQGVRVKWRGHANLLFYNWLNYCVYQVTPYDLETLNIQSREDG
ncbi:MAG TPA: homoserine O-succinyltransferase [Clostridia bacterium]|jgi:homoserine O-succinyltransferase|nr:homoserine O-succinyltransferase [Clostridia bacterium]